MKKIPSKSQFEARHANAVRIAEKVSGLISAGYRVFDEFGDAVLGAEQRKDGDVVFSLKDSGNVLMFVNDPSFDNGAMDSIPTFNGFFAGWSYLHPNDVKTLRV